MVDVTDIGQRIEERDDLGTDDEGLYAYWMGQEAIAEKEERTWIKRAREIVKRYRDERGAAGENHAHRFNILWSNVQTLKPTLYARTPKPDVARRFADRDPTGRLASTLLERCLSYSIEAFDFDAVMKAAVEDRLLPGRGVARVLYVPHFGERLDKPSPDVFEDAEDASSVVDSPGDTGDREPTTAGNISPEMPDKEAPGDDGEALREVTYEEAVAKYVFWEDYREGPARQWDEVPWIRYRSYMTRDELTRRFGKKKSKDVELDYEPKGLAQSVKDDPPPDLYKKAIVHEIWDKTKKQVVWLAPGTPDLILDKQDDPLELADFFPNPDPLLATTTNDKRIPVPDYIEYQDQARELDSLTARIDKLTQALKVRGIYPGENKQVLQQLIDEGTDNRLVPVEDWQAWADKGGMKTFIEWLPIQQIAETLIQLYDARDRVKALLYEITGIGDILRGMTSPDETLGAQELKANFATRRITPQQKDVAKFARSVLRLMAGIVAQHFSAKTISLMTGYPQLQPVPQLPPSPPAQIPAPPQLQPQPGAQGMPGQQPPPMPPQMQSAPPMQPQPGMNGMGAPNPMVIQPPMMPNPAFAQWQKMQQAVQQVVAANQKLQADFDAAVKLIKDDGVHGFRIDIETDSTIAPDEQAEKKSRAEFLGALLPLMEKVAPMAQGNPAMSEFAKQATLFGVRAFRVARPLEESIEKAFDSLAQMPPHPSQGGGKNDAGPDSPQGMALQKYTVDQKTHIEQQKLDARAAEVATEAQVDMAKLAASQQNEEKRLALETVSSAKRDALAGARLTHIEARDASFLDRGGPKQ